MYKHGGNPDSNPNPDVSSTVNVFLSLEAIALMY